MILDKAIAESGLEDREMAIAETDFPDDNFPETYPFSLEQILNPGSIRMLGSLTG